MRIAYVCADFGVPVHGSKGASIHVRELTRSLVKQAHEVLVLTPRRGGPAPAGYGVPVVELAPEPHEEALRGFVADDPAGGAPLAAELRGALYSGSLRHRAGPLLRRWRPDAIYERYSLLGLAGGALAEELDVPYLLEVNAPLAEEHARHRGAHLRATLLAVEERVLRSADVVYVVSGALGRWAEGRGVAPHRIRVVPNAVDPGRFDGAGSDRDATRIGLGLDERPVVGFLGSLRPWHDTATLVRAAARVRRTGRELQLLFVGDGPQRRELEALARTEGVADVTRFSGVIPHERVPSYLAAMDLGAAPYAALDDFYFSPLKLFEYQAAGLPVAAAATGEIGHCVRDSETGATYPPGDEGALADALAILLDHPARWSVLGAAARRHVQVEHTWAATARSVAAAASGSRRVGVTAGGRGMD